MRSVFTLDRSCRLRVIHKKGPMGKLILWSDKEGDKHRSLIPQACNRLSCLRILSTAFRWLPRIISGLLKASYTQLIAVSYAEEKCNPRRSGTKGFV